MISLREKHISKDNTFEYHHVLALTACSNIKIFSICLYTFYTSREFNSIMDPYTLYSNVDVFFQSFSIFYSMCHVICNASCGADVRILEYFCVLLSLLSFFSVPRSFIIKLNRKGETWSLQIEFCQTFR